MRKEFIENIDGKEALEFFLSIKELAPWAAVVIVADSGCWCFESVIDANTWRNQK
jgi:hypothetical protein